jgi:hypothetical protein
MAHRDLTKPAPSAAAERGGWGRIFAVGLIAAVALVYWNSLGAPFLFDDAGAVTDNPTIRRLDSLAVLRPPADGSTTTGRPVVNLSYAINYAISGENVWSYHALNIAIHALAALTLMGIIRRARPCARGWSPPTGDASIPSRAPSILPAFLIALLWALHPLQTESVVCVAQRTETLCGLWYLLTLYGFIRATDPSCSGRPWSRRWLAVSIAACLVGMGTKEVMVTAPLVVLLYDRTFVAGTFAAAWRQRRGYYAGLAATWLLLAWLVLDSRGARGASAGFGLGVSWWTYLLKQCEAILLYLQLSIWPHPLVLDYGTAVVDSLAAVWWQAFVVVALLTATAWALVRSQRAAEAIRHFQMALQLKPAADGHYNAGIACSELGRSEEAAGHFRAALQLNPNLAGATFNWEAWRSEPVGSPRRNVAMKRPCGVIRIMSRRIASSGCCSRAANGSRRRPGIFARSSGCNRPMRMRMPIWATCFSWAGRRAKRWRVTRRRSACGRAMPAPRRIFDSRASRCAERCRLSRWDPFACRQEPACRRCPADFNREVPKSPASSLSPTKNRHSFPLERKAL